MTKILKSVKKEIKVVIPPTYDPKEFFKNRDGLYVWSSFSDTVLKKAKSATVSPLSISSHDLLKTSYDKDIEVELPKDHIFSETNVCAIIAGLIEKQPKGKEGTLLSNGYANIFYTKSRVVGVHWYDGGWDVVDWGRENDWGSGYRVFSPATEA